MTLEIHCPHFAVTSESWLPVFPLGLTLKMGSPHLVLTLRMDSPH